MTSFRLRDMNLPKLRDLRSFQVLAEELHFERAASRLGTTQPRLSQWIRRLEKDVGVRLFDRRPRTRLTRAGEAYLDSVHRVLHELEFAATRAEAEAGAATATLVVGFASSVAFSEAPGVLAAQAAPLGSAIALRELHSGAQLEALRSGAIDLALTREHPHDGDLEHAILLDDPLIAVTRADTCGLPSPIAAVALKDEPFVLFPRGVAPQLHDLIMGACARAGFTPDVRHEVDEWHTIVGLVAAGMGASIAPAGVRRLRWGGVVYRDFTPEIGRVPLFVCWRRGRLSEPGIKLRDRLLNTDLASPVAGHARATAPERR